MEQKIDPKLLFKNYLRDMFITVNLEDLPRIKEKLATIGDSSSWCYHNPDRIFTQKLLCYYLISKGCPEFMELSTIDMVENRFYNDEESPTKYLIYFPGILILRHSSNLIRNKLMQETLMNVISERARRGKSIIVVSDKAVDAGEYTYYDHKQVKQFVYPDISGASLDKPIASSRPHVSSPSKPNPIKAPSKYKSSKFSKTKDEPKECAITSVVAGHQEVNSSGSTDAAIRRAALQNKITKRRESLQEKVQAKNE